MPRSARAAVGGVVYHVLNRANLGAKIFLRPEDYQGFEKVLLEAYQRLPMRILAYCILPTHWHLLLWPKDGPDLSEFMRWLSVTHTQRWHSEHNTAGSGHLYQGRYRSFPIQPDEHALAVCRFIESNPVRTKLARKAEDWKWSSLARRRAGDVEDILAIPPVAFPRNYGTLVNKRMDEKQVEAVQTCITRGRPYGDENWTRRIVKQCHLEFTFRSRGRPRKLVAAE